MIIWSDSGPIPSAMAAESALDEFKRSWGK